MPTWLVARITFFETLRRKDFFVLLILLGLYTAVAVTLLQGRSQDESVRRLLFSLGLTFSFGAAAILVVVLAARQVPKEIEQGTILPLLARPLTRGQFLLGKFLACWVVGAGSLLCFAVLIRLLVRPPAQFSEVLFVQTIVLQAAGLGALAAITLMFSLVLTDLLNITVSLIYYFFWGVIFNVLQSALHPAGESGGSFLGRALYVFPHLEILNISRVCLAESTPLAWSLMLALIVYAAAYAALALVAAHNLFEKRWV
jgi:ABC-type transport system involved in multi-copper enzyme maturation permease subunit